MVARKLILFDIDGTLLTTNGAASRAFRRALDEVYGCTGPIETYDFHGRTDPQIARALLRLAGLDDAAIDAGLDALWRAYLRELRVELDGPGHRTTIYPGVHALLSELAASEWRPVLALLTGNIEDGARLKLRSCALHERFAFGAYGSDDERRDRLPAVAVARARQRLGLEFDGRDVVIVGDTPFDVTCGRELGARAVAVATGRHTVAELEAAGAAAVLRDFADTPRTLEALLAL